MSLSLRDKRYNDVRLTFKEEGHSYTDTFGNKYLSTTTLLGQYHNAFDKKYWLKKKSEELVSLQDYLNQQNNI